MIYYRQHRQTKIMGSSAAASVAVWSCRQLQVSKVTPASQTDDGLRASYSTRTLTRQLQCRPMFAMLMVAETRQLPSPLERKRQPTTHHYWDPQYEAQGSTEQNSTTPAT
jgi:hypothetical protein